MKKGEHDERGAEHTPVIRIWGVSLSGIQGTVEYIARGLKAWMSSGAAKFSIGIKLLEYQ